MWRAKKGFLNAKTYAGITGIPSIEGLTGLAGNLSSTDGPERHTLLSKASRAPKFPNATHYCPRQAEHLNSRTPHTTVQGKQGT